MGTNSASPSPLPSGLSTGKVKRLRNVSVTNIHVSLLSYHALEGVTSLIPSGKGEIEKSINCNCLPNKLLHCVRVGIWKLVIRVTVHMNGLFGDNIQKLKIARLRQDFPKQNHVIETSLSNRVSVELLLPCYACRLFLWTIAFPNHTHVISLLLIFVDTCRTTELYIFHLGYFQISIGYIICKFQFLYIFVANYED